MQKPMTGAAALDLMVRFVGGPPIDDAVYFIRRCAERCKLQGPLTAVLEPKRAASSKLYEVRLERPDRVLVVERDRNVMLAIRNAFDRLPATAFGYLQPAAAGGEPVRGSGSG